MTDSPRPPRRKIGPEEKGVRASLRSMTAHDPALAAQALATAQEIDRGELQGRDRIAARAQVRQCVVQMREWAPGEAKDDPTDQAKKSIEASRSLYVVGGDGGPA